MTLREFAQIHWDEYSKEQGYNSQPVDRTTVERYREEMKKAANDFMADLVERIGTKNKEILRGNSSVW